MQCVKIEIQAGWNNIERKMNLLLKEKSDDGLRLRKIEENTMYFTPKRKRETSRQIAVQGSSKKYKSLEEFVKIKKELMKETKKNIEKDARWMEIGYCCFEKRTKRIYLVFMEHFA